MSSWPVWAGPLLPDTGASTNMTPGRSSPSRAAVSAVAVTPMVPICAQTAPSAKASAAPPANITDLTTSAVGSMVITTWAFWTASLDDAATRAPASESDAVAAGDRSHTVVCSPAAIKLRAIAEPMMPVPSTATVRPSLRWFASVIRRSCSDHVRPALASGVRGIASKTTNSNSWTRPRLDKTHGAASS